MIPNVPLETAELSELSSHASVHARSVIETQHLCPNMMSGLKIIYVLNLNFRLHPHRVSSCLQKQFHVRS